MSLEMNPSVAKDPKKLGDAADAARKAVLDQVQGMDGVEVVSKVTSVRETRVKLPKNVKPAVSAAILNKAEEIGCAVAVEAGKKCECSWVGGDPAAALEGRRLLRNLAEAVESTIATEVEVASDAEVEAGAEMVTPDIPTFSAKDLNTALADVEDAPTMEEPVSEEPVTEVKIEIETVTEVSDAGEAGEGDEEEEEAMAIDMSEIESSVKDNIEEATGEEVTASATVEVEETVEDEEEVAAPTATTVKAPVAAPTAALEPTAATEDVAVVVSSASTVAVALLSTVLALAFAAVPMY